MSIETIDYHVQPMARNALISIAFRALDEGRHRIMGGFLLGSKKNC